MTNYAVTNIANVPLPNSDAPPMANAYPVATVATMTVIAPTDRTRSDAKDSLVRTAHSSARAATASRDTSAAMENVTVTWMPQTRLTAHRVIQVLDYCTV